MPLPSAVPPSDSGLPAPELLQRFANGEPLAPLAQALGVHPSTLYKQMLRTGGPAQYYEAKVSAHQARIWTIDERLEQAGNMLEFNKAHAQAKLARLDYERTCPKEYGPKQELQVDHTVHITVNRQPVIPPVVSDPSIISVDSEVIDNQEREEERK